MVWVKLESIYTETDRFGNSRRWENRLEAGGQSHEVCALLNTLMYRVELPGVGRKRVSYNFERYLLDK